jgi:type VI protein secretion system component Hcp
MDLLTEDLSFTFQKIQVEDKIGNTTFVDDWQSPVL